MFAHFNRASTFAAYFSAGYLLGYLWVARFDDEAEALLLNLLELEVSVEPSCILLLNALAMALSSALSSCRSNSSLYM